MYIRTWRCNNLLSEAGSYLDFSHALLGLAQSAELAFEQGRGGGGCCATVGTKAWTMGRPELALALGSRPISAQHPPALGALKLVPRCLDWI